MERRVFLLIIVLNFLRLTVSFVQLKFRWLARTLPYITIIHMAVILQMDLNYKGSQYMSELFQLAFIFQAVYCELISNLTFFTVVVAMQQIFLPHIFPEFEHGNKLLACIILLLLNIIVTSIVHIVVMLVGKSFLDLKLEAEVKT